MTDHMLMTVTQYWILFGCCVGACVAAGVYYVTRPVRPRGPELPTATLDGPSRGLSPFRWLPRLGVVLGIAGPAALHASATDVQWLHEVDGEIQRDSMMLFGERPGPVVQGWDLGYRTEPTVVINDTSRELELHKIFYSTSSAFDDYAPSEPPPAVRVPPGSVLHTREINFYGASVPDEVTVWTWINTPTTASRVVLAYEPTARR